MKTLLCLGDSNTYGYDPRSFFGSRYPEDVRWTGRLSGLNVINYGVNGATIPRSGTVFAELIKSKAPDLTTVMLGSNDLLQGSGVAQVADRMEAFLSPIITAGRPVLLIAPPPMRYGEWVQSEKVLAASKELGGSYRGLAGRMNILFADSGEWDIDLAFDGVHFTSEGHASFARKLQEIIDRL